MKKNRILAIACLIALALTSVLPFTALATGDKEIYMWIKTNTGVGLNVRREPSEQSEIVATLPYGTMVRVDGYEKNGVWALISFEGARGCYVYSRYLTNKDPGKYQPDQPKEQPAEEKKGYTVDFGTFKHVLPYAAMVSTGSPTGRVYLRWAPGTAYAVMDVCYQGAELTVLSEGDGWCQVMLNSNGYVGFMSSKYIVKKYF